MRQDSSPVSRRALIGAAAGAAVTTVAAPSFAAQRTRLRLEGADE
ncbi:hypothetical protein ABT294_21945 [Nonomuraea sp. NPDC000554]